MSLERFREETATPPLGARERVWRSLERPKAAHRSRTLALTVAFALSALIGIGTVQLLKPHERAFDFHDEHSSVVAEHAVIEHENNRFTLHRGTVAVSSWGAPIEVISNGHSITVESGLIIVRVAGEQIEVEIFSGTALVDSERREARGSGSPSALLEAVKSNESPRARQARSLAEADRAADESRFTEAVQRYAEVASSGSLDAEVANYKQAELELRELKNPARALELFRDGDARFPRGALSQERALSAIESCVRLAQWPSVAERTADFLITFPESERRAEVQKLHDDALAQKKSER